MNQSNSLSSSDKYPIQPAMGPESISGVGDLSELLGFDVCEEPQLRIATKVAGHLIDQRKTVAVAESLTGGLLAASLVEVPGISAVFRGGVVTYMTDTKASVLGVSPERLSSTGPVDGLIAKQMADGVTELFSSDLSLATTGVAGPGSSDGHAPGTVWIGLAHRAQREQCVAGVNSVIDGDGVTDGDLGSFPEDIKENSKEGVTNRPPSSFFWGDSAKIVLSNYDGGRGNNSAWAWQFDIPGGRAKVRELTVKVALSLLLLEVSGALQLSPGISWQSFT